MSSQIYFNWKNLFFWFIAFLELCICQTLEKRNRVAISHSNIPSLNSLRGAPSYGSNPYASQLQCHFTRNKNFDPSFNIETLKKNTSSENVIYDSFLCSYVIKRVLRHWFKRKGRMLWTGGEILAQLKYHPLKWRTPAIQAFNVIFNSLKCLKKQTTEDKSIFYALNVILNHFRSPHLTSPPSLLFLHLLTMCRLPEKGRTLLMEIIANGLAQTLEHPLCLQIMRQTSLLSLRDNENNTIIHMGVLSGNVMIFNYVMRNLMLNSPALYLSILREPNMNQLTPLALAIILRQNDIVNSIRNHHNIYDVLIQANIPPSEEILSPSNASFETKSSSLPNCFSLFHYLRQSPAVWNSPLVVTLRVMAYGVLGRLNVDKNLDNTLVRALNVWSYHISKPLPSSLLQYFGSFKTCILDTKGNTFLMLYIRLGLIETLTTNSDFLFSNWERVHTLYDREGNNVIHLAVESKNTQVVLIVLEHIQRANYLSQSNNNSEHYAILELLREKNNEGLTPIEFAKLYGSVTMIQTLQAHYAVYEEDSKQSLDDIKNNNMKLINSSSNCYSILSSLKGMRRLYYSPLVTAFRIIGLHLSNYSNSVLLDLDKLVYRSLNVIADHSVRLTENVYSNFLSTQFQDCSWTPEEENIFMMTIRLGLVDTLNSPYFHFIKSTKSLDSLYNSKHENIIHLAVLSGNTDVLLRILGLLYLENANIVALLEDKTTTGLNPKELAIQRHSSCIADILSAHFQTKKLQTHFD